MQEATDWRTLSWRRVQSCSRCDTLSRSTRRPRTHSSKPSSKRRNTMVRLAVSCSTCCFWMLGVILNHVFSDRVALCFDLIKLSKLSTVKVILTTYKYKKINKNKTAYYIQFIIFVRFWPLNFFRVASMFYVCFSFNVYLFCKEFISLLNLIISKSVNFNKALNKHFICIDCLNYFCYSTILVHFFLLQIR